MEANRDEDYHEFKATLGYTVRHCLKIIKKKTQLVDCLTIMYNKALSYPQNTIRKHSGTHL